MNNGYAICFNEWALDKDIKSELGLLLIISSLTAEKGYCYASNAYFANLFDLKEETISRRIKKLSSKGYIEIKYDKRGAEIINREIRLTKTSFDDCRKRHSTIDENVKENNTSINNTSINKEKNIKKEKSESSATRLTTNQICYKNEKNSHDENNTFILEPIEVSKTNEKEKKVSGQGQESKIDYRAICESLNQYKDLSKYEKDLFSEYLEMRKDIKVKTTERIINRLLNFYFKNGRNPKIIENAINANWKDFYPLKSEHKTVEDKQKDAIEEALQRRREGKGSLLGEIGL
jgi:hypothetical protein